MNPFIYSDDNKRYHTWNYYLRHRFNSKVVKIPLNAGFTCPNRDGTCGVGGCTFCNALGSGNFTPPSSVDLLSQYNEGKQMMAKKWSVNKTIAYFQAYTNTYGTLARVKECLTPFMELDEVVGIALGTRADCLPQDILDYLDECAQKKEIWIELGLQSIHDETAVHINRGHTFQVFKETVERIKQTHCKLCVHIINGLPNETKEMMIQTIQGVNALAVDAVKIHMLHITTNTAIEKEFNQHPFPILSLSEYVEIVCEQLQYLDPKVILQRLTGDAIKEELITPLWTCNKTNVLNEIDKKMARDAITQGQLCTK